MDIYQTKSHLLTRIASNEAQAEAVETHVNLLIADEYIEDDTPGH